jgi:hypothetical protein
MIFANKTWGSITGVKIAYLVLRLEWHDEHVASGAELYFLNVFSSFQRNFSVIT